MQSLIRRATALAVCSLLAMSMFAAPSASAQSDSGETECFDSVESTVVRIVEGFETRITNLQPDEYTNITVEELAQWFLERLQGDAQIVALGLEKILLRVSSGAGQWAAAAWMLK